MSNPRTPKQLKVISGTDQPCREAPAAVELPLTDGLPPAPDWLPNAHALKEWNRLAPILHNVGLLTEAGLSALAVLCSLHGKIVQLYSAGAAPPAALLGQYRALINDFGLTPVAQTRVKAGGEEKDGNRFSKFGKRPK